jgi:hypothetical protein
MEHNEAVLQLSWGFKENYDSVMRAVLYNSVIEGVINMKFVILTKMCLNETYNRVWVGKHLFVVFPIKNVLKKCDDVLTLLFKFPLH